MVEGRKLAGRVHSSLTRQNGIQPHQFADAPSPLHDTSKQPATVNHNWRYRLDGGDARTGARDVRPQ
jgi:hypothetical protein